METFLPHPTSNSDTTVTETSPNQAETPANRQTDMILQGCLSLEHAFVLAMSFKQ